MATLRDKVESIVGSRRKWGGLCWLEADIVREALGRDDGYVVGLSPDKADADIFQYSGAEAGHCWLEVGNLIVDPWAYGLHGLPLIHHKDAPEARRLYGHPDLWNVVEVEVEETADGGTRSFVK